MQRCLVKKKKLCAMAVEQMKQTLASFFLSLTEKKKTRFRHFFFSTEEKKISTKKKRTKKISHALFSFAFLAVLRKIVLLQ